MKLLSRFMFLSALIAPMGLVSSAFGAESYDIDADHSSIVFTTKHVGAGISRGMFTKTTGEFTYDEADLTKSKVKIVVDASSIFTAVKKRDEHLMSPDFLNVKQYPEVTFTSTSVKKTASGVEVTGDLTLHGVKKSVKIPLTMIGSGTNPMGKFVRGFDGKLTIKRSEFGMTKMIGPVADEIELLLAIEGLRR